MSRNPYSNKQLAPGSFDMLLYGIVIASLVRNIERDGEADQWQLELLDELPPLRWPAPFMAQSQAFRSFSAALEWLGIHERGIADARSC